MGGSAYRKDMSFHRALKFILDAEGGYVHDPLDRGGATNYGITQAAYDRWLHPRSHHVKEITLAEVEAIYHDDYWVPIHADDLPWPLCLVVFDAQVQHRPGVAMTILQKVVGTTVDGIWGPQTREAVQRLVERGETYEAAEAILWARLELYCGIVRGRPDQGKFLRGWVLRMVRLRQAMSA
jgi:lysozyme family protein